MAKEKMTLKGFGWNASSGSLKPTCEGIDNPQPYSEITTDKKHFGMPVTQEAAAGMVKAFVDEFPNGVGNDVFAVSFSKASLFRILAQENCEFVRMYFCLADTPNKKVSLVLEGLDGNRQSIGKGIKTNAAPDPGDDGQFEEKGNGEGGSGMNIVSLKAQKEAFEAEFPGVEFGYNAFIDYLNNKMAG